MPRVAHGPSHSRQSTRWKSWRMERKKFGRGSRGPTLMQAALFRIILFRISRQDKQAIWISQSLRQSKQGNPPANLYQRSVLVLTFRDMSRSRSRSGKLQITRCQRSVIVLILPDLNQPKSKRCPIPQRVAAKSLYGNGHGRRLCGRQMAHIDWIIPSLRPRRNLTVAASFTRQLIWLTMALPLSRMVSRHNLWNGAVRNLCRNGCGTSLRGRQRSSVNWIGLSLSLRRSFTAMALTVTPSPQPALPMTRFLSQANGHPSPWSRAAKSPCGSGCKITPCDRRRGNAHWIGLSLSLHGSHTAATLFARPLTWLTVVLHPSRTVSHPCFWGRAVRTMCGKDRRKPPRSAAKVIMGRNVLRPFGSGIQATPNPNASQKRLPKVENNPQETLCGKPFPMASTGSRRLAREQKSWGTPPVRQ